MADLKAQATVGDTTEPSRKIPFVEKQRRLTEQEGRITGLTHRNEQQPSHALIDACFTSGDRSIGLFATFQMWLS
jgi:hypothetical protein